MKKFPIILVTVITVLIALVFACEQPGTPDDTDSTDALAITGTMNLGGSADAKPGSFVAVLEDSLTKAAGNIYSINSNKSYIICDDFKFKLTGEYNKTTKQFVASSSGSIAGIDMVFSISATYDTASGEVSDGSAALAVTQGGVTTVFSGPLVAQGTKASQIAKVRNFAGFYYVLDGTPDVDYKTLSFVDASFDAIQESNANFSWGQFTLTIGADGHLNGTSWTIDNSSDFTQRWYIVDDGTPFNGTSVKIDFAPETIANGYEFEPASDTTLKYANGEFNCVIKEVMTMSGHTTTMYVAIKLEEVTGAQVPEPYTPPALPFAGVWDLSMDPAMSPANTDMTVNMSNESFFTTYTDTITGEISSLHGLVVWSELTSGTVTTMVLKFTKDDFSGEDHSMEGMYAMFVATRVSATEYSWVESIPTGGALTWDQYDYAEVKALILDDLAENQKMRGSFVK